MLLCMRILILAAFAVPLFSGCSDPAETLRQRAVREYPEWWQKPEQIASVKKSHDIPADYEFRSLHLTGGSWDKEAHRGIYEWTFRFIKGPVGTSADSKTNEFVSIVTAIKRPSPDFMAIDVKHICYYDADAVVPIEIKEVKISWLNSKIKEYKVRFLGEKDYRP